jgi:hypothetical protein
MQYWPIGLSHNMKQRLAILCTNSYMTLVPISTNSYMALVPISKTPLSLTLLFSSGQLQIIPWCYGHLTMTQTATISPQHTLWYWNSPGNESQSSGLIWCTAGQIDPSISKKQSASEQDYLALQVTSLWSITMSGATQPMTQCNSPEVSYLRTPHCLCVLMHEQPHPGKHRCHWLLWDCSVFELALSLAKIETTLIKGHPLTR